MTGPRTEAGKRLLDWFGGPMRPGESRNLQSSITAIEREAADTLDSLTAERDELRGAARQYLAHDGSGIKLTGEWAGDWDAGEYQAALRRLRAALSEGGSK